MTQQPDEPDVANGFAAAHATLLCASYRRWTGRTLIALPAGDAAVGPALYSAPFVVLSHGTQADPLFTYANRAAQALVEASWEELTALPSRHSAEPVSRGERARLLAEVSTRGFIDDYSGVRISRNGRRFFIERATVWNVIDDAGSYRGQAATVADWRPLAD